MTSILFHSVEQFDQIDNTPSTKKVHVKSGQTVSEQLFENYTMLNMYLALGQGHITPEDKI